MNSLRPVHIALGETLNERWSGWLCAVAAVISGLVALRFFLDNGVATGIIVLPVAAALGFQAADELGRQRPMSPQRTRNAARLVSVMVVVFGPVILIDAITTP